ncbi:MAG: ATP-binding protein [Candidatus Ancaeobacter aquaticus]|nr:ATP-binding protein [Candidatus Ancaeobacter aquaticus]
MHKNIYKRRVVDEVVEYLNTDDIIVLHGARQVGKTCILYFLEDYLRERNEEVYFIDLEDSRYVAIIDAGIEQFLNHLKEEGFDLEKRIYVFIDEIQYLKNPSSFMKLLSDHHKNIKLIVSGSSSFEIKSKFKDSLVGRTVDFEVFNLSFEEYLLFKGKKYDEKITGELTDKKIDELKLLYKEYVLYGGYPKIVLIDELDKKERYLQQIIDTYVRKDIRDLALIKDIDKFNKLLEVLASQAGQMLNITELSNTCNIAKQTVEHYLFILENTYIIKLVRPYSKNLRSELFKVPKIYFYDCGLMQMLWLKSLQKEIIGNVFENSIFAELVKEYSKNNVCYWRTMDKKEIDFILNVKNKILPIEVKLNFERFKNKAIDYFAGKYKIDEYRIVGLLGQKKTPSYIYPWEIKGIFT